MKPRNARQREVAALAATLPPLTAAQEQWAADHCFSREAWLWRKQAWCTHCGALFAEDTPPAAAAVEKLHTVCLVCGRRLLLKPTRRQKLEEMVYYTVLTTSGGWQVCRHFAAYKSARRGDYKDVQVLEAVQVWIAPDGHEEIVARPVCAPSAYYDQWNFHRPLELRSGGTSGMRCNNGYGADKYCIDSTWTWPHRRLLPQVRRRGFSGRCTTLPVGEYIKLLLRDCEAEVLSKAGQWELLGYKWRRGLGEWRLPMAHAVRIASRHGYRVRDAEMWMDYLHMLERAGRDTHNPHYICPRSLRAEHDRLAARENRARAERRRREQEAEAMKWEERYAAAKGKYFGLCFEAPGLRIRVIRSVAEMVQEGKYMHHCVYAAGYYKRSDSLILTARTDSGHRLETVEVSLKTFAVVQSRSRFNANSARHDEIVKLVNDNMHLIREIS